MRAELLRPSLEAESSGLNGGDASTRGHSDSDEWESGADSLAGQDAAEMISDAEAGRSRSAFGSPGEEQLREGEENATNGLAGGGREWDGDSSDEEEGTEEDEEDEWEEVEE